MISKPRRRSRYVARLDLATRSLNVVSKQLDELKTIIVTQLKIDALSTVMKDSLARAEKPSIYVNGALQPDRALLNQHNITKLERGLIRNPCRAYRDANWGGVDRRFLCRLTRKHKGPHRSNSDLYVWESK